MKDACVCLTGYGGAGCTRYIGECDTKCYLCNGPGRRDCIKCVENAVYDSSGQCQCDDYYSGAVCEHYIGPCHEMCTSCDGPGRDDCLECSGNSAHNIDGLCECMTGWAGIDCTIKTPYTGVCDDKCVNGCFGPSSRECIDCVVHASRDMYGNCSCDPGWSNLKCEKFASFSGRCFPTCKTCNGPYATDCVSCVDNAHKDMYGNCVCSEYWTGLSCTYSLMNKGPCSPRCAGCTGPDDCDCISCVSNAFMAGNRTCECKDNWGGVDCSIYVGGCNPYCVGCDGPDACNCYSCISHSMMDMYGYCYCDLDWSGNYCEMYVGECDAKCDLAVGCVGPDCDDCLGYRDHVTLCECEHGWSGDTCEYYSGVCHGFCAGCNGPTEFDCDSCAHNADWNASACCACLPGFTGKFC
jgi:proprotein convertase subtilisin/kexin type 5